METIAGIPISLLLQLVVVLLFIVVGISVVYMLVHGTDKGIVAIVGSLPLFSG